MNRFFTIFWHYVKRMGKDPKEIGLLLVIPIGLIIINSLVAGDLTGANFAEETGIVFGGYNVIASFMAPAFLLSFQFFNSMYMFHLLYADLRGGMRWRLLAAPCPVSTFFFPAFAASWLVSYAIGVVYIIVTAVFLNVYWGNFFVLAVVLGLISLMATIAAVLIFLFTNKLSKANAVGYIVAFGLMVLSGNMIPLQLFGDNAVINFLLNHGTPLSIGQVAIISSGPLGTIFEGTGISIGLPGLVATGAGSRAAQNIGILAIITLVLALVTVIAARRRKI